MMTILVGASAGAQENGKRDRGERPTAAEMAKMRTEHMTKALELTPDQQKQVEQFYLDQAQKMEDRKAEVDADKAKMKEILTADQYAEWERMNERGAHRGPGPGPKMKGDSVRHGCKAGNADCCKAKGRQSGSCCKKASCDKSESK